MPSIALVLLLCMSIIHIGPAGAAVDYLIAGGGTAGLVIANRLSEDPSVTVIVIEPGNDVRADPDVLNVDLAGITYSPALDWNYNSTVQQQLGNRVIPYSAGKAIGGTTVINGLYYIRGDAVEYDAWERLGSAGWNWNTLLPNFLKSEEFAAPNAAQLRAGATAEAGTHGVSGPVNTGFVYGLDNGSFYTSASQVCKGLGFPLNQDLNAGVTRGFGAYPKTLDRDANVRESAARAYYEPITATRKNLRIIKGTVKRITWSDRPPRPGQGHVATGFEYVDVRGKVVRIAAAREVILSTGTLVSPVILENSGIGDPKILKGLGIKVKHALPGVGEGLQDQPLWTLIFASNSTTAGQIPFAVFASGRDLFQHAFSSLACSTRSKIRAWARTISQRLGGRLSPKTLETRFRVQHDLIFKKDASVAELAFFNIAASGVTGATFSNLLPFSWGSVHLATPGQVNNPAIDVGHLSLGFDVEIAMAAGRLAREVWATKPLSDFVGPLLIPGETLLPPDATEEQWKSVLTSTGISAFHGVGTCAMLPQDLGGVVDTTLKVYGTSNVRVIDASVIPQAISGHPSAAVYALAERVSGII